MKGPLKSQIKDILYAAGSQIEGESESYWFIFQVIVELLIEFLHAGFKAKEDRIKLISDLAEGIISQIKNEPD